MTRRALTLVLAVALLPSLAFVSSNLAQKKDKPWTEWSKSESEKMLVDSPWARTQVETDTSELFYTPTSDRRNAPNDSARLAEGATNQQINVKYHVRFFSARPIRQALARTFALQQPGKLDPGAMERLQNFANLESSNSIIVTVSFEASDQRSLGKLRQSFNSAVTATLKNNSYLERADGQRLFLEEYVPPGKDGFGARFIFLRIVDGHPFLDEDTKEVRFFTEFDKIKVNVRFKTSEMIYDGKLEY